MTNKTVLMLMGPSGCGKSTLERNLLNHPDTSKVVSVTTRPPREGEVDGVDYQFIDNYRFQDLADNDELIQTTHFADHAYGSTRDQYTNPAKLTTICIVPSSAVHLKEVLEDDYPEIDVVVAYFDISPERLRKNMEARGDTTQMIEARLMQDDLRRQMTESGLTADLIITDTMLNEHLWSNVLHWLELRKITNG